ncbi:hypothetical protein F751_4136 [Auxenochlorella protothecoides]|uniref:DUF676 domain-containing protein n=2 Tax=Auxenochlorella protothecoides TaxID=3075 RepID=A0A087SPA3_AUXPR|nr:hypothetical protein F751_4136 [Auxenochlorella protothecoides]KFM27557.1 hypothetical protein F751_4136 [Auxenochlorella protothecoides]
MSNLRVVKGPHGVNKVHCVDRPDCKKTIVYFGGDQIHQHGVDGVIIDLQSPTKVAKLLCSSSGGAAVYSIEPSRREAGSACYDNFLHGCTLSGEPLGYKAGPLKALPQLLALLIGAGWEHRGGGRVDLIAFSKGGVVLNQILTELAELASHGSSTPLDEPGTSNAAENVHQLTSALQTVQYLDVGLNCRGAFLTDPQVFVALGTFAARHPRFRLELYTTPWTREGSRRPWLVREREAMLRLATQRGVPCLHSPLFADVVAKQSPRDLLMLHFKAHLVFLANESAADPVILA